MIGTVTINPAIDYIISMERFEAGKLNRAKSSSIHPGGKGVNVSLVLHTMGAATMATGFLAGATGKAYEELLAERGVPYRFLYVKQGHTRINTKVSAEKETEINGCGPEIEEKDLEQLCLELNGIDADYVVLSGNVPANRKGAYLYMLRQLKDHKQKVVVDTTGKELLDTLPMHPFLIKPNKSELEELFSTEISSEKDLIYYAEELKKQGAQNVMISLGKDGILLLTEDGEILIAEGVSGKTANTVGAGDSTIAGFLYGWQKHQNYYEALKWAAAAGTATAFSYGIASKEKIENYYEMIVIKQVQRRP